MPWSFEGAVLEVGGAFGVILHCMGLNDRYDWKEDYFNEYVKWHCVKRLGFQE